MSAPLARLVFPSLRGRAAGFAHERAKIDAALRAGVGGFIVFSGSREHVAALTRDLRAQAGRPLLIGADLERGTAQQVRGLTELPPPGALGFLDDLEATATAGLVTAVEARGVGINWAFAPVCDLDLEARNPIVQTRSFGADPQRVATHAARWIRACQEHGVAACAKHYPGHGRTVTDSHETLPVVPAPLTELQAMDALPFAHAVAAGAGTVMTAHVAYSQWDAARAATFSPAVLGYLRTTLGFAGPVVTDALIMEGALAGRAETRAVVAAVAAGCDFLLYPRDFVAVVAALEAAVGNELSRARVDEALARYESAVASWDRTAPPLDANVQSHATFAESLADRALHWLRGEAPRLGGPLAVTVVDDDVGGPYRVGPRDVFAGSLRAAGVPVSGGEGRGARVVLVYAEPLSWKGRAHLSERSRARLDRLAPGAALIVLFGHPRLAAQLPGSAPVLCAWHGQPLMQRAAARRALSSGT